MMRNIEEKAEALIRKYNMIEENDVVIAGVSGGADSVCLLFVLCALKEKYDFSIRVCHVNHGLRGADADADEQFVKELCRKLNVPCRVFHRDVELIARKRKQSPEEAGRMVRREAFEIMCREEGGTRIAAAHHCDDNAETILLNLARGTGIRGLCGIRPVYGKWIRPLLGVSRGEIESALSEEGISWRRDMSNEDDIYTRNRIRHHILPSLQTQVNPETVRHLNELSRQAQEVWDYISWGVENAWKRCVIFPPDGEPVPEIREVFFRTEMPAVQKQLIHRCICTAAGKNRDVEAVHVEAVLQLFDRQAGKRISLPFGVTAYRTYEGVLLKKDIPEKGGEESARGDEGRDSPASRGEDKEIEETRVGETELKIPGETSIPGTPFRICCRVYERRPDNFAPYGGEEDREIRIPQKSYTKCFDYDIIKHTAFVRKRRPGDYLIISRNGGRQKLKSYFINEKVPRPERDRIFLIADGSHVMWIPGMRMSAWYQISKETKRILEIKITEEKENGRDDQSSDSRGESGSEN